MNTLLSLIDPNFQLHYGRNLESRTQTWSKWGVTIEHHHQRRRSIYSSSVHDPEHRWRISAPRFKNFLVSWSYGIADEPIEGEYT